MCYKFFIDLRKFIKNINNSEVQTAQITKLLSLKHIIIEFSFKEIGRL